MKHKCIYILSAILLLAGCSQNLPVDQTDKGEQKVIFKLSAKSAANQNQTDADLPAGSTTGVYVTDKDASLANSFFSNWQYNATTAGSLTSGNGPMILTIGRNYDIYGYSPFNKDVTNAAAIPVSHGTDVLWAPKVTLTNVTELNNTAALTFKHSMAQVAFNVVFDPQMAVASPVFDTNSKIQITGFYAAGTLNAATGVITPTGNPDIVLSGTAKGTPGAMTLSVDPTMILPAADMTLAVAVTHDGKTYNGSIKVSPIPGNLTTYSVIIRGTAASLSLGITASVEQWVDTTDQADLQ